MSTDILTVSEARKVLAEIKQLASGKTPDKPKAAQLAGALANTVMHVIELHGDQRSRGLIAVLREVEKIK